LIEIREIPTSQSEAVNRLVSEAFGYAKPRNFFEDFPIWSSNQVTRLGAFDGNTLVSHVGIRFVTLQSKSGDTSAALIGGVATDQKYRGQGISSQLLREAIRRIEASNTRWSILWGSEEAFYEKVGFKPCGFQARALIQDLAIDTLDLKANKLQSGLTEKIWQDFLKRKSGVRFEEKDRDWFFRHGSVEWYYFDEPFAYVAYQRGMDLKTTIHEIGGEVSAAQRLLYHIYLKCEIAQVMGSPSTLLKLGFSEKAIYREAMCLARPTFAGEEWKSDFWISGLAAC
jgi:predicted N-acetyltransferase YhbS